MKIALLLVLILLNFQVNAIPPVKVLALYNNKAYLQVDQRQIMLTSGQAHQGVFLVSADARQAVIEYQQKRYVLAIEDIDGSAFLDQQTIERHRQSKSHIINFDVVQDKPDQIAVQIDCYHNRQSKDRMYLQVTAFNNEQSVSQVTHPVQWIEHGRQMVPLTLQFKSAGGSDRNDRAHSTRLQVSLYHVSSTGKQLVDRRQLDYLKTWQHQPAASEFVVPASISNNQ